jgi:hypothetical protein
LSLPALLDPDGVAFKAFDVEGIPVPILIDQQGRVVEYWESVEDKSEVQLMVELTLNREQ